MIDLEQLQKVLQQEVVVLRSENAVLQVRMGKNSVDFGSDLRRKFKQKHLQKQSLSYKTESLSFKLIKISFRRRWLKKVEQ